MLFKYLESSETPIELKITAHTEANWPPLGAYEEGLAKSFASHLKKGQGNYREGLEILENLLEYEDRIVGEESPSDRYKMIKGIVDDAVEHLNKYSHLHADD
jgi:hypothetical protein